MEKKKLGKLVGAGVTFGVVCVAIMFLLSQTGNILVNNEIITESRSWKPVTLSPLGDASPGAGKSGVLKVYICKNATFNYNNNISIDGNVWASGDNNNSDIGSDVPDSQSFDIIFKVRWNQTHAGSGGVFDDGYVSAYLNCSDLSISSLSMDEFNITGVVGNDFMFVHYVANDYQLTKGQSVSSCIANFMAYYE